MGNCKSSCSGCGCNEKVKQHELMDYDLELEKKNLDYLFTAPEDKSDKISFADSYTTAPAIKIAGQRIEKWLSSNEDVKEFTRVEWLGVPTICCQICHYNFEDVKAYLVDQEPLAYSYWKGVDVKDYLSNGEVCVIKYLKSEKECGICIGCWYRSDALKLKY